MVTRFTVMTISQCIQMSSHYAVHLKLMSVIPE